MNLGERIISLRKSKGISQELLAENSRVSLRTIQRIESGRSIPRPHTIKVIAQVLEVPVGQLAPADLPESNEMAALRLINLSTLVVVFLPLGNIVLPLLIWRKHRKLPLVNVTGRKIIGFQMLWTLTAIPVALFAHMMLISLTRSVSIGRMPPTIFLIYFGFVVINLLFIIRSAVQLGKEETSVYSFVPDLF